MQAHEQRVAWLRTLTPDQRAHAHNAKWYRELPEAAQQKFDEALDEISLCEFHEGRSTDELVDQAGIEDELDEDFDLARDVYGGEVDAELAGDVYELDSLSAEEECYE